MIQTPAEYRAALTALRAAQQRAVDERTALQKQKLSKPALKRALAPFDKAHMEIQHEVLAYEKTRRAVAKPQEATEPSPGAAAKPAGRPRQPKRAAAAARAPDAVAATVPTVEGDGQTAKDVAPQGAPPKPWWHVDPASLPPMPQVRVGRQKAVPGEAPRAGAHPRVMLIAPPADLLARGVPIKPLTNKPPRQTVGAVLPSTDVKELRAARSKLLEYAHGQGYWVTDMSFVVPQPLRLVVVDYYLLTVVHLWLRNLEGGERLDLDHDEDVIPFAAEHPGKARVMDLDGQAIAPGPLWPRTVSRAWLQFGRDLHAAGFVRQERAPRVGRSAYIVQPTQIGLVRGLWAARNIDLTLPIIG